ncbi:hypothetical protein ACQP0C_27625 [Nocardia sp. CA-129566]
MPRGIHDRAVLDAFDWLPGTRLGVRCGYDGILLAYQSDHGTANDG